MGKKPEEYPYKSKTFVKRIGEGVEKATINRKQLRQTKNLIRLQILKKQKKKYNPINLVPQNDKNSITNLIF